MDRGKNNSKENNPFIAKSKLQRSPPSPLLSAVVKEAKTDNLEKMPTRGQSCKICRQILGVASIMSCHYCNESYHAGCIGYTDNFVSHFMTEKKTPFICFSCSTDGTHYSKFIESRYSKMESSLTASLTTKLQELIKTTTSDVFQMFKEELETHKSYMVNEMEKLRVETEQKLERMEIKITQSPPVTTYALEKISALQEEINYLHAKVRGKNLMISGITEETELDLKTIVQRVGNIYGVAINSDHIVSATRSKQVNNPYHTQENKPEHPSNIFVEFTNEALRNLLFDNYLASIRSKKSHPCSAIGINSSKTIYINEHLPKYIQAIKNKARLILKAGGFDAVIAKPLYVAVKKGDSWIKISTTEQMDDLISNIGAPKFP